MENRIKIVEAISLCNVNTGTPIKDIEAGIMCLLWPESTESGMKQNLYHLKKGKRNKLSLKQVKVICDVTGSDANFLFGIES